jgi:hypothetical protein
LHKNTLNCEATNHPGNSTDSLPIQGVSNDVTIAHRDNGLGLKWQLLCTEELDKQAYNEIFIKKGFVQISRAIELNKSLVLS